MASALLQPDAIWSGLNGLEILQHLSKIYAENHTMPKDITEFRKNRLPDARGNGMMIVGWFLHQLLRMQNYCIQKRILLHLLKLVA